MTRGTHGKERWKARRGKSKLSQNLGGQAGEHPHSHTHSGAHGRAAFSKATQTSQPFSGAQVQARGAGARTYRQDALGKEPHGHCPQQQPPAREREKEARERAGPACQSPRVTGKGPCAGDPRGPGRKSLTAVGQGPPPRAGLAPCRRFVHSGPRSVPLSLEARNKASLAQDERRTPSHRWYPSARRGDCAVRPPHAGVTRGPLPPRPGKKESLPLGPGGCCLAEELGLRSPPSPFLLPSTRACSPSPHRALQAGALGPGSGRRSGVALTSGSASGAAARAHWPFQKHPPAAHRQDGRPCWTPWAAAPGARAAPLGPRPGSASARVGTREPLSAERGARSPGVPAHSGHTPEPRAPAASYPRRRVLPFEAPPAHRRGEGAAPTNWGARPAALRSPLGAAAPGTVRSAGSPAFRELAARRGPCTPGSRPPPSPAASGAPPWGPGSASGCCCCSPPFCSTRSTAGPLRR